VQPWLRFISLGRNEPFYFRALSPRRALVYSRGTDKARDPSALYRAVTIFIERRFTSAISRARVCPRRVNTSPNQFSRDRNISQLRPGRVGGDECLRIRALSGLYRRICRADGFFPEGEAPLPSRLSRGGSVPSVAVSVYFCATLRATYRRASPRSD